MDIFNIGGLLGNMDIYLLDQVMKGRYASSDRILDAGCGIGRNMTWFLLNRLDVYGLDLDEHSIAQLRLRYPDLPANRLQAGDIGQLPFKNDFFDHVVCSAVLHFAGSQTHFDSMLQEMVRVLKPGGTLFIRMAASIGIETVIVHLGNGIYRIPDGSDRFLLTRPLLARLLAESPLSLIEPVKTVNVQDMRCMTTLVLQKVN